MRDFTDTRHPSMLDAPRDARTVWKERDLMTLGRRRVVTGRLAAAAALATGLTINGVGAASGLAQSEGCDRGGTNVVTEHLNVDEDEAPTRGNVDGVSLSLDGNHAVFSSSAALVPRDDLAPLSWVFRGVGTQPLWLTALLRSPPADRPGEGTITAHSQVPGAYPAGRASLGCMAHPAQHRRLRRRASSDNRWRTRAASFVSLAVLLAMPACVRVGGVFREVPVPSHDPASIRVASFDFSESAIIAEIYAIQLESHGFDVQHLVNLGSREVVQPALQQGKIDFVPEYLGAALEFVSIGAADQGTTPHAMRRLLDRWLSARDVSVLPHAAAQNQNGIVVTRSTAERYDLRTITHLRGVAGRMVFGGPPECPERLSCLRGLETVYDLHFQDFLPLDVGGPATVAALEGGEVDVGLLFTTDPDINAKDLVLLKDDQDLQPAENVVPVIRQEVVDRYGTELTALIDEVTTKLTTSALRNLNERVELDGQSPAAVARDWLAKGGLIDE